MTTYRFKADIKAHTDAGTEILTGYRVTVETTCGASYARDLVRDVAFETIADAGSDLLDGNLERIEVSNIRLV